MKINIKKISDYLINIGIGLSLLTFYLIYNTEKGLPDGVCPISNNNRWVILSISISLLGVILSFLSKDKSNN